MEGEVGALLIVTVAVGSILMISLLICYICVFKELCCTKNVEPNRNPSHRWSSKRSYLFNRGSNNNGIELTHVSSQITETEKI